MTELQFTNTLTGRKEPFRPMNPSGVRMYVCGVTVYDDSHLGHARGAVVFDTLRRFLERRGLKVTHVRNITDVDDKIIARARREPASAGSLNDRTRAVAERYTRSFQKDFIRLGLLPPTHEPKATEYIPKIQKLIARLIDREMAYVGEDGVYFAVRHLGERYGRLSNQKLDQMLEAPEAEPESRGKMDPWDFALWKRAKSEEPAWDSPWGAGRPGWHIECTTMATDLLGQSFDIHGGGRDLIFPHHENELAQALGAEMSFAKTWLHNGLLTVEGQKMSKSVGNIVTIEAVLKKHPADVLRLFFLGVHYRSPMDFTWEHLEESAAAAARILGFLAQVEQLIGKGEMLPSAPADAARSEFEEAMADDLNTPRALAALHGLVTRGSARLREAFSGNESFRKQLRGEAETLRELTEVLGLRFFRSADLPAELMKLREERDQARKRKDFKRSDEIREQVKKAGFLMEDTGGGTVIVPDV